MESSSKSFLQISSDGDSTVLITHLPIPGQLENSKILCKVFLYDNDFDFSIPEDRIFFESDTFSIIIVKRPEIELLYPPNGSVTSCNDDSLVFIVTGDNEIDFPTVRMNIADRIVMFTDTNIVISGDTIIYYPDPPFDEGLVEIFLIEGYDLSGYSIMDVSWQIHVDQTGPEIYFTYPEDGAMLPLEMSYTSFEVTDEIAGVDYSELIVYVLDGSDTLDEFLIFDVDSSGIINFNLNYYGISYTGGDSFTIIVEAIDDPDLCDPNRTSEHISFWFEPQLPCSLSTNPFTPNEDGYNDVVTFWFPGLYSRGGRVEIYDLRGVLLRKINVAAGALEKSATKLLAKII
jgi:hypothetical protein